MTTPKQQSYITASVSKLADDYASVCFSSIRLPQDQVEAAARALGLQTFRRAGQDWLRGRRPARQEYPRFQRRGPVHRDGPAEDKDA